MKNIHIKALQFIQLLNKAGIPVSKAYLFGSYARGTADENSDIDICIVSDALGKDYFEEMVKLRMIAMQIDSRIEPVPFAPLDLKDTYNTLAAEIRKYGVVLQS